MRFETLGKWMVRLGAASLTWLSSSLAFAQGCAMCYNNAAATKASGQQALRSGILILMIPPLVMLAGIFVAALRRRNKFFGDDAPLLELSKAGDGAAARAASRARRLLAESRSSFVPSLTSARTTDEMPSEDLP
jgi:hypothetical protein